MVGDAFAAALSCTFTLAFIAFTPPVQPAQAVPIAVEDARIVQSGEDLPPQVRITVRNTGTRVIEAWGIHGEVRYANGRTQRISVSTDAYETMFLSASHQPRDNKRMVPDARTSIPATIPSVLLTEPIDAAAIASFAVFDDDTAVGDERGIEFIFERRRFNQRVWRLADEALKTALAQGFNAEQAFAATSQALDAAGDDIRHSSAANVIRMNLSVASGSEKLEWLRAQIASRLRAANSHGDRRR